ncbi:MAG: hypothetical protein WA949_19965 [Phormidesmis sp.]
MKSTQVDLYPFVEEFVTDSQGQIQKVVLQLTDYRRLIEMLEDEGLYQAMQASKDEVPLSLIDALQALESDEG